jgi:hypothetical protein
MLLLEGTQDASGQQCSQAADANFAVLASGPDDAGGR